MTSTTTADQLLAELLERRATPVATVVAAAPGLEGDLQSRLDIRAKDVRKRLEDGGLPSEIVERVSDAVREHTGDEALGIVADADGIVISALVDADEDDELVELGTLPRYVPFLRDRFENRPHVVVRCDRTGASVARVQRGEIQRDTDVVGEEQHVQKVHSGGFSQARMQRHSEHTWEQNAKEIAESVAGEAAAIDAELVIVTGDERAVHLVAEHLPERWADALVLDDHQPFDDESDAAVFERAATLVRDRAARELVELLERFAENRGRGEGAADDLADVLTALRQGAVETLLVTEDAADPVHVAVDDPMQIAFDAGALADLGFADVRTARLTDAAVRAALAGGADVVVVPAHGPNSPKAALGAILRY